MIITCFESKKTRGRNMVNNFSLYFLALAVVFNTLASLFFKFSSNNNKNELSLIFLVVGLLLGAVNAFFYTRSLKGIELNIAYPIFSAASIMLISFVSWLLFKEKLTTNSVIGSLIILFGIILISRK
jgi:multidrug transporter EmrE-like cation transporter